MAEKNSNLSESAHYVNLERLTFLVDGVFAITLTLLVLELRPPEVDPSRLAEGLLAMLPKLGIYLIAFFTIANHWVVQQRTFRHVTAEDTRMVWLTMIGLLFITLMPATTAIVGQYPGVKLPVAIFSANSFLQSLTSWLFWSYVASKHRQFAPGSDPRILHITERVWMAITIGWFVSIFLSLLNVYATYVSWILWPNVAALWAARQRRRLIGG